MPGSPATPRLFALVAVALACRPDVSQKTVGPAAADRAASAESPAPSRRSAATEAAPEPGRLQGITEAHNRVREPLSLPPLTWSPELARYAQSWADKLKRRGCDLEHRPGKGPDAQKYGENLFGASGQAATSEQVVAAWAAEVADYDAKTGRCRGVCGHYTQIVWRSSQRLGCGVATCGDSEVWVCNYDPPGNFLGQRPY